MKPQSIFKILAVGANEVQGPPLSLAELGVYLQRELGTQQEAERNKAHALRDAFYRDGGCMYMCSVIDAVFTDTKVRELRKRWVKHARFNNALKRIVNELSTVYAEPAKRTIANGQESYDKLLEALNFDEQMLQLSRLLNLHRAMLVSLRVREVPGEPDGDEVLGREPVLDMVSPADARVVLHPCDNKLPVGWIIRCSHRPARGAADPNCPKWHLWTDVERIALRDDFSVIGIEQHGLGVNPWVPVTLGPIDAGFWPGEEGEDLVAAHVMIWFQAILLAKESKSATKQPIIAGDGTLTARGQASDTEIPAELADGQSITTVDMSMDLSMFRDTADHVLNGAGYNYGLSAAILQHQGVQSAEARKLMRIPLGEIRKHQQQPLRRFEQRLAIVMSTVLEIDLPAMSFDPTGWRIEFGDEEIPMSAIDQFNLFVAERQAGTDNTIAYLMRKRPGQSEEEAQAELKANIAVELNRNLQMRPLQQISGSMGASTPAAPNLDAPGAPVDKLGQQTGGAPAFVSPATNSLPVPATKARMGNTPPQG